MSDIPQAVYDADMLEKDTQIAGLKEQLALSNMGLTDPSVIRSARAEYGAIEVEEGKEKPSLADVVKGWKDDPTSAPLTLRGVFGGGDKGKGDGAGGSGGGTGGLGGDDEGGNGAGSDMQADASKLMELTAELRKRPQDKDLRAQVKQMRDAVMAASRK